MFENHGNQYTQHYSKGYGSNRDVDKLCERPYKKNVRGEKREYRMSSMTTRLVLRVHKSGEFVKEYNRAPNIARKMSPATIADLS